MTDKIKEDVRTRVLQLINGQTLEQNKFEVKRQWYDLSWKVKRENGKEIRNKDYYEFLKDCTSIVNSYGGEDGFIIIGIDGLTLMGTSITDSGLDDPSKIKDIIIANVDKPFPIDIDYLTVNGKSISIIYLPPSTDKPHLINEYYQPSGSKQECVIFYRNGTGSHVAKKGNIDLMYWERGNIILEKKLECHIPRHTLEFKYLEEINKLIFSAYMVFESLGTRDIMLHDLIATFHFNKTTGITPEIRFTLATFNPDKIVQFLLLPKNQFHQASYSFNLEQSFDSQKTQQIKNYLDTFLKNGRSEIVTMSLEGVQTNGEKIFIATKLTVV
jgi:hypothetical protein